MAAPGFEWLTNYLQAIRLFNVQAGLIYTGIGCSVTALNYLTSKDASPDLFADKTWPIMAIAGLVITAVDLGRIGLEYLNRKTAKWTAEAEVRQQREAVAAAKQEKDDRLSEAVVATMRAIEDIELKRTLKYILLKPDRRFTAWGTSTLMDDLLGKRIVHMSVVEDGFTSNGTYLVHPAIWAIRGEFLMANNGLGLQPGKDYASYNRF